MWVLKRWKEGVGCLSCDSVIFGYDLCRTRVEVACACGCACAWDNRMDRGWRGSYEDLYASFQCLLPLLMQATQSTK